jgi:hypothetical protein
MPSETDLSGWHVRKEAEVRIGQVHIALEHWVILNLTRHSLGYQAHAQTERINQHGISKETVVRNVVSRRVDAISTCNDLIYSNEVEHLAKFLG